MGLIKGTASKKLYGVVFKTEDNNGYNNNEMKTLVIINANSKKYAKTKAFRVMEKKEMNTEDLWLYNSILDIENKDTVDRKEFTNIFEYITI